MIDLPLQPLNECKNLFLKLAQMQSYFFSMEIRLSPKTHESHD